MEQEDRSIGFQVKVDHYRIRIYYNELLFLYIKREEFVGFQSWLDNKHQYCIEFVTKTNKILVEFDKRYKWESILKQLDKVELY